MSSDVLGKLINLRKQLGIRGRLVLQHSHPNLVEIFRITRLDQVFELEREHFWAQDSMSRMANFQGRAI